MLRNELYKTLLLVILVFSVQNNVLGSTGPQYETRSHATITDDYKPYNETHVVRNKGRWLAHSGASSGNYVGFPKNNLSYSMWILTNPNVNLTTKEFDWNDIPSHIEFNETNPGFTLIADYLTNNNDDLLGFGSYEDNGYSTGNNYESEILSSFDILAGYQIANIIVDLNNVNLRILESTIPNYDYYIEFNYNVFYEIWVFVFDNAVPTISDLSDFYVTINDPFFITWYVEDSTPYAYDIFIDNELVIEQYSWKNGTIQYYFVGKEFDTHNVSIYIYDYFGHMAFDNVTIVVQDTEIPNVIGDKEYTFEEGAESNNVIIMVEDHSDVSYNAYINNELYMETYPVLNQQISANFDHLTLGHYNVSFEIYDIKRNTIFYNITIHVVDLTSPLIDVDDEYIFYPNDSGNIEVSISEQYPDFYQLYMGDVLIETKGITSNTFTISFDVATIGRHSFTLHIYDTSGNSESKDITIIVEEYPSNENSEAPPSPINYMASPVLILMIGMFNRFIMNLWRGRK